MSTEIIPYEQRIGALTVTDVRAQVNLIQHIMREVMQGPTPDNPEGVHYGIIPGTGKKPSLFKPGAEKLCLTFRLDPQYEITEKSEGSHLTVVSKCTLFHIPSGQRFGSGMGSCSTKESKYAYRQAKRKCPKCGAEAINKSKFPPKGAPKNTAPGWYCYAKQGGCGKEFAANDDAITGQEVGRVPNEDVADQYNTVLKMANKRSLVAAVLNCTAASDIFTQDIEDTVKDMGSAEVVDPDTGEVTKATPQQPVHSDDHAGIPLSPTPAAAGAPRTRQDIITELCEATLTNRIDLLAKAEVKHEDEMSQDDFDSAVRMLKRKQTRLANTAQP